ncbi:MAG: deoxyribonuclease IV [Patescibacteria group bacterium]|jgi:deoxyribonuclease-4
MKIGGHISVSGGVLNAFERAESIGANCFQIFASSPRMWAVPDINEIKAKQFKQKLKSHRIIPSFIHLKYLINIASPNEEIARKSVETVKAEMRICSKLGLAGGMFHIGTTKGGDKQEGLGQVASQVKKILQQIPQDVLLLLENSASPKKIGSTLEEIAELLEEINNPQVSTCLDTAHAFAAGYDLHSEEGVMHFIDSIEKTIGLNRVTLFHINDSKSPLGSGRDWHENIGKGKIGINGIRALLTHPKLHNKPFITEVPGIHNNGPDKPNIALLRKLAGETV